MQSADDVKLGHGLAVSGSRDFESLVKRHGVGAGRILFAAKSAQPAGRHAYVSRIDFAIDVEIRLIRMHALADMICHPSNSEHIASAIESERVAEIETVASHHLGVDGFQPRVVSLK